MQSKVQIKLEQIARLRVAGAKDTKIAEQIGISYGGLTRIIALDEYKEVEDRVATEVLGHMDAALVDSRTQLIRRQKVEALREEIRNTIPDALTNLLDAVKTKRDLRASLELLDRDPDCVAVKRSKADVTSVAGPTHGTVSAATVESIRKDADATRDLLLKVGQPVQAEATA